MFSHLHEGLVTVADDFEVIWWLLKALITALLSENVDVAIPVVPI
jgi:hypothetical protein